MVTLDLQAQQGLVELLVVLVLVELLDLAEPRGQRDLWVLVVPRVHLEWQEHLDQEGHPEQTELQELQVLQDLLEI